MATVEYIYKPCEFEIPERVLKKLEQGVCLAGDRYWLSYRQSADGTLLELSPDASVYRYVYVSSVDSTDVLTGEGRQPSPKWLNPEAILHRDKQPLPFSWRS